MPEMDGEEAQQKIHEVNSDIPIIALTANVMLHDVNRYLQMGFTEHLGKPVDINVLYGMLAKYTD